MPVRSLDEANRTLFENSPPLKDKPSRDAISAVMYFMAPDSFAKHVWLHFSTRPDPCAYLQQVFKGSIFFDRESL